MPVLPDPLPATIDAQRAAKPVRAIETAASAVRTAKEALAARERQARERAQRQAQAEREREQQEREAQAAAERRRIAEESARAVRAARGGVLAGRIEPSAVGGIGSLASKNGFPQVVVLREFASCVGSAAADVLSGERWSQMIEHDSGLMAHPAYPPTAVPRARAALNGMRTCLGLMEALARGDGRTSDFIAAMCGMGAASLEFSIVLNQNLDPAMDMQRRQGMRAAWETMQAAQRLILARVSALGSEAMVASADVGPDGRFEVSGIPPGKYVMFTWTDSSTAINHWVKRFDVEGAADFTVTLSPGNAINSVRRPAF
jgi:hypothetical protein